MNTSRLPRLFVRLLLTSIISTFTLSGAPSVTAVLNGASFVDGPLAPGTIISIFGTGLAPSIVQAQSFPLPTTLAGTSLTINGQAVPIFFVAPNQINAQLPFQLQAGTATLVVRDGTGATGARTISIASGSPGIFTTTSNGKGEAISVHADFSLVKKAVLEYARTGETIVLFVTGLGAVDNFAISGAAAPYSPLSRTTQAPVVSMDGRQAQVVFSGLAPGFVGLYQINFVVPPGVGGDVNTTISIGGSVSNSTTINVAGAYTLSANYTVTCSP